MIKDETDYTTFGNPFPVDDTAEESQEMKDYLYCDHNQTTVQLFVQELEQQYFKTYGITKGEKVMDKYETFKNNLGRFAITVIAILSIVCIAFFCMVLKECSRNAYFKARGLDSNWDSRNIQIENGNELPSFDISNILDRFNRNAPGNMQQVDNDTQNL
jgi:hypothetical protein